MRTERAMVSNEGARDEMRERERGNVGQRE